MGFCMHKDDRILITGSSGMVGRSLVRELKKRGYVNLHLPDHHALELREKRSVDEYFSSHKPKYVFHLAARVGGIYANSTYPADFIYDNTMMQSNVIDCAFRHGVKKILFPGSACAYPKLSPQPVDARMFLSGAPELTNLAYAVAKISGIVMCQSYAKQHGLGIVLPMVANTYGVGDNFSPEDSHVIPAVMSRIHEAMKNMMPSVTLWGTGRPMREFIYVDDLVDALLFLMDCYDSPEIVNIGTMQEVSIADLAMLISEILGFKGTIIFDHTKSDGVERKCLNSQPLFDRGWKPKITLREGLERMSTYYYNGA